MCFCWLGESLDRLRAYVCKCVCVCVRWGQHDACVVVDPSAGGVKLDAKARQLCWVIGFDMTGVIQKDYALIVCVLRDSVRQNMLPMRALSALIVCVGVVRDSVRQKAYLPCALCLL